MDCFVSRKEQLPRPCVHGKSLRVPKKVGIPLVSQETLTSKKGVDVWSYLVGWVGQWDNQFNEPTASHSVYAPKDYRHRSA